MRACEKKRLRVLAPRPPDETDTDTWSQLRMLVLLSQFQLSLDPPGTAFRARMI